MAPALQGPAAGGASTAERSAPPITRVAPGCGGTEASGGRGCEEHVEGEEAFPERPCHGGDGVVPQAREACSPRSESSFVHSLTHSLHRYLLCLALSRVLEGSAVTKIYNLFFMAVGVGLPWAGVWAFLELGGSSGISWR